MSLLHFEFPQLAVSGASADARIALAFWRGAPDPAVLGSLLEDRAGAEALATRVAHPRRLSESLVARLAGEELSRRTSGSLNPPRHLSYSHTSTGGLIVGAIAAAEVPIGIDLEPEGALRVPEPRTRLLERILSEGERDALASLSEPARLDRALELWCAKESLAKALGTGLVAPLAQYEATITPEGEVRFRQFPGWGAKIGRESGFVLSLCLPLRSRS